MTIEQLKAKFPHASEAFLKANLLGSSCGHAPMAGAPVVAARTTATARRIRQSHKPLMNKLEQRWLDYLNAAYPTERFLTQALRFRLANGVWYKPDIFCWSHDYEDEQALSLKRKPTAWECKGPHAFRGGFENLKVAAAQYPDVRWLLVWEDNGWNEQEVLP